ncbi:4-hydroxy-tetrahydrodipicolinate reductase [Virgibacillus sp. W0181]|uniref:4-hydroxy-tetrahydrodipicolinate reductase n=1 Tax=Virgibacillus sp. W0181 TaxID=3391581 RepID=UPI003F4715D7
MSINVVLAGPRGRMGTEAIKMIEEKEDLKLVACIDRKNDGMKLKDIHDSFDLDIPVYENPVQCLEEVQPDVLLDLTVPASGFENTLVALQHHVRPVVGTSGFTNEQLQRLNEVAKENKTGCIIAPNFALGAVLMMQFSKIAAKYFPNVEIIEKHHDQKIDAPSGSLMKTVDLIKESRKKTAQGHPDEYETIEGARGGDIDGLKVHSVRLPGLMAQQEVIFGGTSQLLTIKHDSFHRDSFMEGIYMAIRNVMEVDSFIYGLENILEFD